MTQKRNNYTLLILLTIGLFFSSEFFVGCAQIGSPTGGAKDSTAPVLIKAQPVDKATNFTGKEITFSFDEFIELADIQNNLLVSPSPKNNPSVNYKLRTVTVRLKDTLIPNTTYSINFGNAVKDINEGNILPNLTYVFSTGNTIDSLELSGTVTMAETGLVDSTLQVLLYKSTIDTLIKSRKPDYIAKLNGSGGFKFAYLAAGSYIIYALKDGDGNKYYNRSAEPFAFYNQPIILTGNKDSINLYAFAEEPARKETKRETLTKEKLKYSTSLNPDQDVLSPFKIIFNKALKKVNVDHFVLRDTSLKIVSKKLFELDSTKTTLSIAHNFVPGENYKIIINKDDIIDTVNASLTRNDTLSFKTQDAEEYGSLQIRFKNLDLSKKPLLQLLLQNEVILTQALTQAFYDKKLLKPGEYSIRIVYDMNGNGKWDTGNYSKKLQPEKSTALTQKITVRANWENESDIEL